MLLELWQTVANDADDDAFNDQRLFPEVDLDRFELLVFRQQRDQRTVLAITLDGNLVIEARHDNLPAANLGRAMHGNEIAIKNARIFHTHAVDA